MRVSNVYRSQGRLVGGPVVLSTSDKDNLSNHGGCQINGDGKAKVLQSVTLQQKGSGLAHVDRISVSFNSPTSAVSHKFPDLRS